MHHTLAVAHLLQNLFRVFSQTELVDFPVLTGIFLSFQCLHRFAPDCLFARGIVTPPSLEGAKFLHGLCVANHWHRHVVIRTCNVDPHCIYVSRGSPLVGATLWYPSFLCFGFRHIAAHKVV